MSKFSNLTNDEQLNRYDDMLDECYESVEIAGITFSPSAILKKLDPIAYNIYSNDWINQMMQDEEDEEKSEEE